MCGCTDVWVLLLPLTLFQAKGLWRKPSHSFETCGWTLPSAVLSPAESVGDWLWQGYNFTLGRDVDISFCPFCLFIRLALFKDKKVHKPPKLPLHKGTEKGSRLPYEILKQHLIWNYLGSPVFPDHCWILHEHLEAASEGALAAQQFHCSTSTDTIYCNRFLPQIQLLLCLKLTLIFSTLTREEMCSGM